MIQWTHTLNGDLIASEQGRQLCSARDPQKEARTWCDYQQSVWQGFTEVSVVGIGAAYHLIEMAKRYPQMTIRAYDSKTAVQILMPSDLRERLSLIPNLECFWGSEVFSQTRPPLGPVVKFLNACGEPELQITEHLLGHHPHALQTWSEELSYFSFSEKSAELPAHLAVNIKTLPIAEEAYLKEVKLLHVLKELVR